MPLNAFATNVRERKASKKSEIIKMMSNCDPKILIEEIGKIIKEE